MICAALLIALPQLAACRDEPAAAKQDRETGNLYSRHESIRTAYGENVDRSAKQDRLARDYAAAIPQPPGPGEAASAMLQTASLAAAPRVAPPPKGKTGLVAFATAPFPYNGPVARTSKPFHNIVEAGRRGHRTAFNRVYWEDETYSDPRVLLHIPPGFDAKKPSVMVLFFHGHGATLERDVQHRQQLPRQITESGVNAVLVAPQLAVDARDSSPGKFWRPGGVRRFLAEATTQLARLHGERQSSRVAFATMPVVIVAYSGGFVPAAWAISHGGLGKRLRGVVLLDALYGETHKFTSWIGQRSGFFVSAYANSTRARNQALEKHLTDLKLPVRREIGAKLERGSVVFLATANNHRDFVTDAWVENPIKDVLQRMQIGVEKRKSAMAR